MVVLFILLIIVGAGFIC
ncbi:YjcZ family sporulation protein [Lysinibacillus fusiformis]